MNGLPPFQSACCRLTTRPLRMALPSKVKQRKPCIRVAGSAELVTASIDARPVAARMFLTTCSACFCVPKPSMLSVSGSPTSYSRLRLGTLKLYASGETRMSGGRLWPGGKLNWRGMPRKASNPRPPISPIMSSQKNKNLFDHRLPRLLVSVSPSICASMNSYRIESSRSRPSFTSASRSITVCTARRSAACMPWRTHRGGGPLVRRVRASDWVRGGFQARKDRTRTGAGTVRRSMLCRAVAFAAAVASNSAFESAASQPDSAANRRCPTMARDEDITWLARYSVYVLTWSVRSGL